MQVIAKFLACFTSCTAVLIPTLTAGAQSQPWIRQIGTNQSDQAYAVAPDGTGGAYISGWTSGSLGGPNAGQQDAWLARYDSAGNQLWIRQLGTSSADQAYGAAPDGSGGVYISGSTHGDLGGPNAGMYDAWVARYDSAGNQLWIRQLGTSGREVASAATPDGSGGVYIAGGTTGSLGGPNAGMDDAWLARFDGAGNQLWIRQLGTSAGESAYAASPNGSVGVYIAGGTEGSLGGPSAGSSDAWLARYDSSGLQYWIRQFGSAGDEWATAAAPGVGDGVYICGATTGSLGGPNLGGQDAWLARYDSGGNPFWIRQFGSNGDDSATGVASDGFDGAYVCGSTTGSLGGSNAGSDDAWLARFDYNGNQLWIRQIGSASDDFAYAAAGDGWGSLYVGGTTAGSLGGASAGDFDAWLARYVPNPVLLCEPGVNGVIACPCSNPPSGPGRGCDNSRATGGATIQASGNATLAVDTLAFTASDEPPTSLSLLLQGGYVHSSGVVYGQGVSCVGGILKRLFNRAASAGSVMLPNFGAGDTTISARSAALGYPIYPGQSRWYLVYYRDPTVLGGCPSSRTFNSGPTMRADWVP